MYKNRIVYGMQSGILLTKDKVCYSKRIKINDLCMIKLKNISQLFFWTLISFVVLSGRFASLLLRLFLQMQNKLKLNFLLIICSTVTRRNRDKPISRFQTV